MLDLNSYSYSTLSGRYNHLHIDSFIAKVALRPALREKQTMLEIIRNDLCSYSSSDIPRVTFGLCQVRKN